MNAALEAGELSATRPGCTLPPGKTRYPLYRRMSGYHGQSGRAENLAPPGFDSRTVQPVGHRCMWADHLVRGLIFSRETITRSEVATELDTCQLCASVCAKPEVVSPRIPSVGAYQ